MFSHIGEVVLLMTRAKGAEKWAEMRKRDTMKKTKQQRPAGPAGQATTA